MKALIFLPEFALLTALITANDIHVLWLQPKNDKSLRKLEYRYIIINTCKYYIINLSIVDIVEENSWSYDYNKTVQKPLPEKKTWLIGTFGILGGI